MNPEQAADEEIFHLEHEDVNPRKVEQEPEEEPVPLPVPVGGQPSSIFFKIISALLTASVMQASRAAEGLSSC